MSTFLVLVAMLLHFGSPVNQSTTVNSLAPTTSSPSEASTIRAANS